MVDLLANFLHLICIWEGKTMDKIEVRCRDGYSDIIRIEQAYGNINEDSDIHIMVVLQLLITILKNIRRFVFM